MDNRLLLSSIGVNTLGIMAFSVVYSLAPAQSSNGSIAVLANDAILVLAISAGLGLILLLAGLARRGPLGIDRAALLGLGNFALGFFSLFQSLGGFLHYQDELAACGGFPAGYWTTGNATVTRCSIFVSVHYDWVSYIYGLMVLTCATAFFSSVWTVIILKRR